MKMTLVANSKIKKNKSNKREQEEKTIDCKKTECKRDCESWGLHQNEAGAEILLFR